MNIMLRTLLALALVLSAGLLHACGEADTHDTHDAHDDHAGESGTHEEEIVSLTPEQLDRAGVRTEPLAGGVIATHIILPAEVGLNLDAVLHITPRASGIVAEVHGLLGQSVRAGDLLAVLESPELGEARIELLQANQAKSLADAELERQRTVSDNTATLLQLLREEPELDQLYAGVEPLRIGENKGRLLSAYAKMRAAEANYAREREVREKGLSTQADLLAAQEAYNSSRAEYFAAYEDIEFTYRLRLQDARRAARVAVSAASNAGRRLRLLGLTEAQVTNISDDPGADIARYELRTPAPGRIIAKHITPGEKVSTDDAVYTVADLGAVWLNISVYARYAGEITEGQAVTVRAEGRAARGVVEYLSETVSEGARTVLARVVLPNDDRAWKPGEFLTVLVATGAERVDRMVPVSAIQTYEGREVVFVQSERGIAPVPIETGLRNEEFVEIVGKAPPVGASIVVKNSFLMKSELGKSAAGHVH